MTDTFTPKNADIFNCEKCDFKCCKRCDWNRHVLTLKHLNTDKILTNTAAFTPKNADHNNNFICDCGKQYKHRQSLFNHKKKCSINEKIIEEDFIHNNNQLNELKGFMKYLMKENTEMKNMIIEQQDKVIKVLENGTHNITTTNTNSHNKSFNLNFFLNETCKDAMNINEFIESIKLQLSDLEGVGQLGYVEGISNIIVKNLKQLDITQRPLHCTDKKRETIYIKDEDKWEKDEEKDKMHKIVRKVADKNARMLPKFKEAHPDCNKAASKYSDAYNKIIVESMGGSGDNNFEKEEKIIKKVSKEIILEKEN
jgi:hypothetical protein